MPTTFQPRPFPTPAPAEGSPATAHAGGVPDAPLRRRILVVDDNRDAAESLAMLVELLGYEAQVCFDGPTALAAFDQWSPHLVLLDLTMPGMSGFEVVRRMRERSTQPPARLVALSGHAGDDDRLSLDAGFDAHLVKPVDVATLQSTLSTSGPT